MTLDNGNYLQVREFLGHLGVACISNSYFFHLQKVLLHRIIWMMWMFCQKTEISKLKQLKTQGHKIALAGDGQFDSPGIYLCAFLQY